LIEQPTVLMQRDLYLHAVVSDGHVSDIYVLFWSYVLRFITTALHPCAAVQGWICHISMRSMVSGIAVLWR